MLINITFIFISLHPALAKSGSESSISEACDNIKESQKRYEDEKEECSDKEDGDNKNNLGDKMSMSSTKSMSQLKDSTEVRRRSSAGRREVKLRSVSHIEQASEDNDGFENIACGGEKGIRPSKSDTSLTDSFVMIDNDGGGSKKNNSINMLRDGEFYHVVLYDLFANFLIASSFKQVTNGNNSSCSGQN